MKSRGLVVLMKFKKIQATKTRLNNVSYQQKTKFSRKSSTKNSKKLNANLKCLYQKHRVCDGCDYFLWWLWHTWPPCVHTTGTSRIITITKQISRPSQTRCFGTNILNLRWPFFNSALTFFCCSWSFVDKRPCWAWLYLPYFYKLPWSKSLFLLSDLLIGIIDQILQSNPFRTVRGWTDASICPKIESQGVRIPTACFPTSMGNLSRNLRIRTPPL